MNAIALSVPASGGSARRFFRRVTGLLLGSALPTYFFTWILGFNAIKAQVNGRVWCAGANSFAIDEKLRRTGSKTAINDTLICRKGEAIVRRVGEAKMWATNFTVAFGMSLALMGLLVLVLLSYKRLGGRLSVRLG